MSKYVALNEWGDTLVSPLFLSDGILPIARAASLADALGSCYTYLMINDGVTFEVIKATQFGTQVKIERGLDGTTPRNYAAGACVKWKWVGAAVRDFVCQMGECPTDVSENCGCEGEIV